MEKSSKSISASEFFKYRYPPFADTVELNTPFQSANEKLILERSLALIRQGKSLAIYGDAGAGKSMLTKSIIQNLDAKTYRTVIIPYGGMKPSAIIRELCEAFNIDLAGRKNLIPRLQKNFHKSDKPFPVIVVDDAHTMENQSFMDLCSLLHDARTKTSAASLILVGQPILKKRLGLDIFASVHTRLACFYQLPTLSIDEAKAFIQYRLKISEADPNMFDDGALECLAADTAGNRRVLMNRAALCMEEAARRQEKIITMEVVNDIASD
jgi:type II secretory pathway predicted ATPase ExeA